MEPALLHGESECSGNGVMRAHIATPLHFYSVDKGDLPYLYPNCSAGIIVVG